ncbi:hypothetical protein NMY22_g1767 [Coprinellus aureogranulatus]|nr:hypothetical protein NMY22_g1767 [Coprinellus aureogranulatus]
MVQAGLYMHGVLWRHAIYLLAIPSKKSHPSAYLSQEMSSPSAKRYYTSTGPVARYVHGQPLTAIIEEKEAVQIGTLPVELLTKILQELVGAHDEPFYPSDPRYTAFDLLAVSQTSSLFRKVALANSRLWSFVPFLNCSSPTFFDAILTRSQPHPIRLSILEKPPTWVRPAIWERTSKDRLRIHTVHVQVAEGCESSRAWSLLSAMTPVLKRLFVKFHGNRLLQLSFCPPDSQGSGGVIHACTPCYSPDLQIVHLTNCYLSPNDVLLPHLSHYHVEHRVEDAAELLNHDLTVETDNFLLWTSTFRSLRNLSLLDVSLPGGLASIGSVDMPALRNIIVSGPAATCREIGLILRIPPSCHRSIAISVQAAKKRGSTEDTSLAVDAALAFVDFSNLYTISSISLEGWRITLQLRSRGLVRWLVEVTFNISLLNFCGRSSLPGASSGVSVIEMFARSWRDVMLLRLCERVAVSLRPGLAYTEILHIRMSDELCSPEMLLPFLSNTPNVHSLSLTSKVWADPCFTGLLDRHLGCLKTVIVVLDSQLGRSAACRLFTCARRAKLECVVFQTPSMMIESADSPAEKGRRYNVGAMSSDVVGHRISAVGNDMNSH